LDSGVGGGGEEFRGQICGMFGGGLLLKRITVNYSLVYGSMTFMFSRGFVVLQPKQMPDSGNSLLTETFVLCTHARLPGKLLKNMHASCIENS
jgi:hypothetical protein